MTAEDLGVEGAWLSCLYIGMPYRMIEILPAAIWHGSCCVRGVRKDTRSLANALA
jgi:hypothetical protein